MHLRARRGGVLSRQQPRARCGQQACAGKADAVAAVLRQSAARHAAGHSNHASALWNREKSTPGCKGEAACISTAYSATHRQPALAKNRPIRPVSPGSNAGWAGAAAASAASAASRAASAASASQTARQPGQQAECAQQPAQLRHVHARIQQQGAEQPHRQPQPRHAKHHAQQSLAHGRPAQRIQQAWAGPAANAVFRRIRLCL